MNKKASVRFRLRKHFAIDQKLVSEVKFYFVTFTIEI